AATARAGRRARTPSRTPPGRPARQSRNTRAARHTRSTPGPAKRQLIASSPAPRDAAAARAAEIDPRPLLVMAGLGPAIHESQDAAPRDTPADAGSGCSGNGHPVYRGRFFTSVSHFANSRLRSAEEPYLAKS